VDKALVNTGAALLKSALANIRQYFTPQLRLPQVVGIQRFHTAFDVL